MVVLVLPRPVCGIRQSCSWGISAQLFHYFAQTHESRLLIHRVAVLRIALCGGSRALAFKLAAQPTAEAGIYGMGHSLGPMPYVEYLLYAGT